MLKLVKRDSTERYSFIQGLFVEEEYRHSGIAKRLINEVEKYSKSIGCKNIKAEMRTDLFWFYNKLGFSIFKQKNGSTYWIIKNLERNKETERCDDCEER